MDPEDYNRKIKNRHARTAQNRRVVMDEMKKTDQGFTDQLPMPDVLPSDRRNPRQNEMAKYNEVFFDPRYDGFESELEFITDMPFHASKDVDSSPLGVGFELLDHRTGYVFDKVLPFARNTGVKWARLQTGWQRAEKEPGKYDFVWLDEIVDGLLEAGIQPWFSLSFGNGLYMDAEPIPPHSTYLFSPTRFGEKGVRGWTNYCKAMAEHFKTRVFHWEVWNEPNAGFLRVPGTGKKIIPENPAVYTELVAITAKALRSVQPQAKIIAGSISGAEICNEYISKLFRSGIAEHIDIFSYHPYQQIPEIYYQDRLQYIRDLIAESGRPITIWQGENGRPSNSALLRRGWKATEGSQARYLTRRYLTDLRLGVEMTSYFLICDIGNGYFPNGNVHSQGVIDATDPDNYRPKLAYRAMQSMAWLFDSRTKLMHACFEIHPMTSWGISTLPLETADGLTCAFRRGNIPIFAYYHPTNIDADWQIKPVQLVTWLDGAMKFDKPILIDPITARIYRIVNKIDWCHDVYDDMLVLPRLPLLDYPLFVTDASLMNEK